MNDDVFFSVIMPIYNVRKDYLYAAFESLEKQTYQNFEIIIINDGADEATTQAIEDYSFKNPKVFIYKQINQGQYISRINGLKRANGDYIFFFDSDDLLTVNAFEILNDLIKRYHSDVIMYGLPRFFVDESDMIASPHYFEEGIVQKETIIDELLKLHSNNICSKCARRELLSTDTSSVDKELRNGASAAMKMYRTDWAAAMANATTPEERAQASTNFVKNVTSVNTVLDLYNPYKNSGGKKK